MIPLKTRTGATVENISGETRSFTIKATGEAFRTLIDGLYSNKVRSIIRELCSNAKDSHTEARNDGPFLVCIPTHLDPTFRVRDYGTGISHDDVMEMYTTIFESSRDKDNETTGRFGLGSKSPFAYTDSFCATSYQDGTKNLYLAHLATDGIPALTHVSSEDTSEPDGFEVSFAVKQGDHHKFQTEMQFVAMGYPTPPTVEGMVIKLPAPIMQGSNWALYNRSDFRDIGDSSHYVRQGSAIYPSEVGWSEISYATVTITDVPIGTCEVVASREALAYDFQTNQAIKVIQQDALVEIKAFIEGERAKAVTRIEKARAYSKYGTVLNYLKGSTVVSILKDDEKSWNDGKNLAPGESLIKAKTWGAPNNRYGQSGVKYSTGFDYTSISSLKIIINDASVKMVRRKKRLREAGLGHSNSWIMNVDGPVQRRAGVKWLTEILELGADQFVLAETLTDYPPDRTARNGSSAGPRRLAAGQKWMPRCAGHVRSDVYGVSNKGIGEWPFQMKQVAKALGYSLNWDDVFFVNEKQEETMTKRGLLPKNERLDTFLAAKMVKLAKGLNIDKAIKFNLVLDTVGQYNQALPVVLAEFFPELVGMNRNDVSKTIGTAELAKISLHSRPIADTVRAQLTSLAEQYPLLFQSTSKKHFEQYVTAIKATKEEVTQ